MAPHKVTALKEQEQLDKSYMERALSLAAETAGLASPNPQVGCIIVRDGQVLGEGAHLYENYDHAEIAALKQVNAKGLSPKGATAYVTLEPCSHHGRTGPCADALIAADIARCVVATADPNPLVSGQGLAKLRAAGIEVVSGVLEEPARRLNEAFAHFIRTRTPFVTLKAALSSEGKLAPSPGSRPSGEPYWLTGPEAREEVHLLRHASDAIVTGIGTVLADDPLLTDRSGLPRRRPLLRVVLDTHLRIPLESQLVRSVSHAPSDLLILYGEDAPISKATALIEQGIQLEMIPVLHGHLSLAAVLSSLAQRSILSVLLEGGSALNGSFLREDLVHKVVLFYADKKLGDSAVPFAQGVTSPYDLVRNLQHVTRARLGSDLCVTGYLHDPWSSFER